MEQANGALEERVATMCADATEEVFELVDLDTLCERVGVDRARMRRWMSEGWVPYLTLGRGRFGFDPRAVRRAMWMRAQAPPQIDESNVETSDDATDGMAT